MKTQYIIKKEEGIVVCLLTHFHRGYKYTGRGVAKLNPEDEWNEEFGKRLASARAQIKLHTDMRADTRQVLKIMERRYSRAYDEDLREKRIIRDYKERVDLLKKEMFKK